LATTIGLLAHNVRLYSTLGSERSESKEELRYLSNLYHFLIIVGILQVVAASFILLGAIQKAPWCLRTAASSLVYLATVKLLFVAVSSVLVKLYVYDLAEKGAFFVVTLYCGAVLWSYAERLEQPVTPGDTSSMAEPLVDEPASGSHV